MRRIAAVVTLAVAACAPPPPIPQRTFPTLAYVPPPPPTLPESGLAALRDVTHAKAISLEVGREDAALLALHCHDTAAATDRPEALRAQRACYRCALAMVSGGPEDPYDSSPFDHALHTIAETLARYPDSFVTAANLDRLAICSDLTDDTHDELQVIAGLAEQHERRMLLRMAPSDFDEVDEVIHHEMFHLFDFGTVTYNPDPAWEFLNPAVVSWQGFVDRYAQTDVNEDKATVFQFLMSGELCDRAANDPLILAKARTIRDRIAGALPAQDAAFFGDRASCL